MLLALQLIAVVGIIVAAITGKGSRSSYFWGAIAATLIALSFLSMISIPPPLVPEAERAGVERFNALATTVAWTLFAAAIGSVLGGCMFRAPRPVTGRSEAR